MSRKLVLCMMSDPSNNYSLICACIHCIINTAYVVDEEVRVCCPDFIGLNMSRTTTSF